MNYYQIEFGTPEYDEAVRLRYKILREPLGLDFTAEDLAKEYDQYHLGAYDAKNNLVGYLLLSPKAEHIIQMRQVAVQADLQNRGIGKGLVYYSESFVQSKGYKTMMLHARDTAVPFYEKLGYKKVGSAFEEVGIKHYKMEKLWK